MRILLDENLDWRLRRDLPGHEVESVPFLGWAGISNGALLLQAQDRFDVLITMDSNLASQQNLASYRLAAVALSAPTNRLADTRPLMPRVLALLPTLQRGTPRACRRTRFGERGCILVAASKARERRRIEGRCGKRTLRSWRTPGAAVARMGFSDRLPMVVSTE